MAGRTKRRANFNQQDGSEAEAWIWILETERLIEEMKAAPSDPGIDCVFRTKLDSDSGANWTVIPEQTGQRFRRQTRQFLA